MQKLEKLTFRATFKKISIVSKPNIKEKTTARSEVKSTFTIYSTSPTGSENHLSHYDFKHLTEKYFEIGMKLDDFLIQLVKYCIYIICSTISAPRTAGTLIK